MISDEVLAIIPARGGSKRIPRKNVALLGGEPLIKYTILAALGSKRVSRAVVSTDDRQISQLSTELGAEVLFPRPRELATDTASSLDVLQHAVRHCGSGSSQAETVVLLQPTSPFRTSTHIDAAIDLFLSSQADTVIAVRAVTDHPYWMWKPEGSSISPLYTFEHVSMGRQLLPTFYLENGSIYVLTSSLLLSSGLYGSKVVPFVMGAVESLDVDEPLDLAWAEFLLARYPAQIGKRS